MAIRYLKYVTLGQQKNHSAFTFLHTGMYSSARRISNLPLMPKKPSHRSIVRDIREILGLTQTALAKRLGTTMITINRIENGSLKISRRLALRLSWSTGVNYQDLLTNAPGRPQTWHGELSSDRLEQLDQKARNLSAEQLATMIDDVAYHAELMFKAVLANAPRKLWSLDAAIGAAFDQLEQEFGLTRSVKRVRESQVDPSLVESLQKKFSPPPKTHKGGTRGTESTARRSVESSIEV
jgi:transcriptional regulator with XRE-family HTH domain